jgi:hypothetical protein
MPTAPSPLLLLYRLKHNDSWWVVDAGFTYGRAVAANASAIKQAQTDRKPPPAPMTPVSSMTMRQMIAWHVAKFFDAGHDQWRIRKASRSSLDVACDWS